MMFEPAPSLPAPTGRLVGVVELPAQRVGPLSPLAFRSLLAAYRMHGHRVADLDPIGVWTPDAAALAELEPSRHGIPGNAAGECVVELGGMAHALSLAELTKRLRETYCGSLALDASHLRDGEQRRWLYERMEQRRALPVPGTRAVRTLELLVAAEAFEQFQRVAYPGQKQYTVEGCEALIAFLDTVLEEAAGEGTQTAVLGMAHRGRLNAFVNVVGLPAASVLSLFTDAHDPALAADDLKDHLGCTVQRRTPRGEIELVLAHNPSHLGSVVPVVCGMARAIQDRKRVSRGRVLPILVHGDATFPGQGVIAETLNLAQTRGFGAGGTLHVILNNQIGSTISDARDARSTLHAADLARGFDVPIVHVNADDPEAALYAAALATAFRLRFGADVLVNLVGFRRFGHFGGDDPTMTQPAMQRRIRQHPGVASLYAATLVGRGVLDAGALVRIKASARDALEAARRQAESRPIAPARAPVREAAPPSTTVPLTALKALIARLSVVPADLALHPNVDSRRRQWQDAAAEENPVVDWCLAESLAYACLLREGFNIRLTGLDVGRGTFFHRDAVWHDQAAERDGERHHVPLRHLGADCGQIAIFESPLSEEAVLGFEYGYSVFCGRDLVVWEAQFGDFVNNAQTIIDQFIASGERKWNYESGLVMLLPHGLEGNGAEHSSGFLGRFLQLCGDGNLRVAVPSTAAQLHHLLRRQALAVRRTPLVVMSPKFLLRKNAASFSRLADIAADGFRPLLGDRQADPAAVTRAILASGKLRHDVAAARAVQDRRDVAIVALEELYPFPAAALASELARYPRLASVVFAQEEPRNHGAWHLVRDEIEAVLPSGVKLCYAGRPPGAPAGGCDFAKYSAEQSDIVARALG